MSPRDFLLSGSQGPFRVPVGESRVGSDAACEICVHGESILPVHAYLRSDGDKILIRPAAPESASGSSGVAPIIVEGSLITGPTTVLNGQHLDIGSVQLQLLRGRAPRRTLWQRSGIRALVYTLCGLLLILLLGAGYIRFFVLNEDSLKEEIREFYHAVTGRPKEDVEVAGVNVRAFAGRVDISGIRVKERCDCPASSAVHFIQIPSVTVTADPWRLLTSWGRDVYNLDILAEGDYSGANPELILERSRGDGSLNIEDILRRYGGTELKGKINVSRPVLAADGAKQTPLAVKFLAGDGTLYNVVIGDKTDDKGRELAARYDNGAEVTVVGRVENRSGEPWISIESIGEQPLDFKHLDFHFRLNRGLLRLRDSATTIPDTTLDNIVIEGRFAGAGQPLLIEKCELRSGGNTSEKGSLALTGKLRIIDSAMFVRRSKFAAENVAVEMSNFDLARFFDHFGYSWVPNNSNFKVVLGKPITGRITLNLASLNDIRLQDGILTSDSLVSIREENRPPLGSIPMELKCADLHLIRENGVFVPKKIDMELESWTDPARRKESVFLTFGAKGHVNPNETSTYDVNLECGLQELLDTDVGRRMKLDGTLGGMLTGHAKLVIDTAAGVKIDTQFRGRNTYVMLPAPEDAAKPPEQRQLIKQNLPLSFDCYGSAQFLDNGMLSFIDIARFSMTASSFSVRSESPSRIDFQKDDKLSAEAQFALDLHGREFCREFSPILSLFGFRKPFEEDLALKVGIFGKKDILSIGAEGTASRQWGATPTPVKVVLQADYNKPALRAEMQGALPYLAVLLHTQSAGGTPLNVNVEAHCTRRDGKDIVEFYKFSKDGRDSGASGLTIDADLKAFNERFSPYIEYFLEPREGSHTAFGLLERYRQTAVSGTFHHDGRIRITHAVADSGREMDTIDFDSNTTAQFDALEQFAGQPFQWQEPNLSIEIKGAYDQDLSTNPEEPDKLRKLNIEHLKVRGSLGKFEASLSDLDLLTLPLLRAGNDKTWAETVSKFSIEGSVSPQAARLIKAVGILDPRDPISGTVDLNLAYDRSLDSLDIKQFDFRQSDGFYVEHAALAGSLAHVRDISAHLFPTRPSESTLAVRAAEWLDEGGMGVLFDHLGADFTIQSLRIQAKPFRDWLAAAFPVGDARKAPPLFAGILDKTWEPQAVWRADNLQLLRDRALPGTFRLKGRIQSDFTAHGAPSELGPGAAVTFAEPWDLEMGLSLNNDNVVLHGSILLDGAVIAASIPGVKRDIEKPSGQPLTIELEAAAAARGSFQSAVSRLRATGVFGEFEARNIVIPPARTGFVCSIEKFTLSTPALNCAGSIANFEPRADHVDVHLEAPECDARLLPQLWMLTPSGSGKFKNVTLAYKGGIAALLASLHPTLRPTLAESDPHRAGLNPQADTLDLEGDLTGASIPAGTGQWMALDGRIHISGDEMSFRSFTASLGSLIPGGGGVVISQHFAIPRLRVRSSDPQLNLSQALAAKGMPLDISGEIACTEPLAPSHIAALHQALRAVAPETPLASSLSWSAAQKMLITVSVNVAELPFGEVTVHRIEAKNALFKDLRLSCPLITAEVLGGRLQLEDAELDLSKVAAKTGITLDAKGLRHSQRVTLSDGDLCKFLGGGNGDVSRYALCGRVDVAGNFNGVDFGPLDRLSWNGALRVTLRQFATGAPAANLKELFEPPLPWMTYFTRHGRDRLRRLANASLQDSISSSDLAASEQISPAMRVTDGFLAACELYLAKGFGVENLAYEFEPVTPTARIDKGLAVVEPFELKGKGASLGIDLQVRNLKINLADETFADEMLLFPTKLPADALERLALARWPANVRQGFLDAMRGGKIPLRVSGKLSAPIVKFPWPEIRMVAREALFNADAIGDAETLAKARAHFFRVWGRDDGALAAAALVADRMGAGIPGTRDAFLRKESLLDNASKIPARLAELAAAPAKGPEFQPLSPAQALKELLFNEDPLPPPVPPANLATPPPPPPPPGTQKRDDDPPSPVKNK